MKPSLAVNNLPQNLNLNDRRGENYAVNDLLPTALGRPSHCNTIFSPHNSLLHYWDTPSLCQVTNFHIYFFIYLYNLKIDPNILLAENFFQQSFCCFPGVFHNPGDENDQSSQDSLKPKLQDSSYASTDFIGE